jgi:aminopeptidase N
VPEPDTIHAVRVALRRHLAQALKGELLAAYQAFSARGSYSPDAQSAGQRALKNTCLSYLMESPEPPGAELCLRQLDTADNMTDAMAALAAVANTDIAERPAALEKFHARWKGEPLVVDKWLAVQAGSRLPGTLEEVKRLTRHPAFDIRNPNKVYALIRTFAANQVRFHSADGAGYAFVAEQVLVLDALNPQIAARIARAFDRWRKFGPQRQQHARAQLERIRDRSGLSKDALEVVSKALA